MPGPGLPGPVSPPPFHPVEPLDRRDVSKAVECEGALALHEQDICFTSYKKDPGADDNDIPMSNSFSNALRQKPPHTEIIDLINSDNDGLPVDNTTSANTDVDEWLDRVAGPYMAGPVKHEGSSDSRGLQRYVGDQGARAEHITMVLRQRLDPRYRITKPALHAPSDIRSPSYSQRRADHLADGDAAGHHSVHVSGLAPPTRTCRVPNQSMHPSRLEMIMNNHDIIDNDPSGGKVIKHLSRLGTKANKVPLGAKNAHNPTNVNHSIMQISSDHETSDTPSVQYVIQATGVQVPKGRKKKKKPNNPMTNVVQGEGRKTGRDNGILRQMLHSVGFTEAMIAECLVRVIHGQNVDQVMSEIAGR